MNKSMVQKSGRQLWEIYHTDREYARELGDPLRTVVEAPSKLIAEETAAQLGFGDPWAHPVNSLTARRAQWIQKSRPGHRQELAKNIHQHPHLIMQTPSIIQIRTAIEVLKKYGEHVNNHASNMAIELAESPQAIHDAGRITAGAIEQTTRIETVAAQLEQWRDELMQQRRQCVCNHI
jgi:hypothetical protein